MGNDKIRVMHFTNAQVYAGAEEHMLTLLRGLDREEFRPFLACHPVLYAEMKNLLPADVEVFPVELNGFTSFGAVWQLAQALRKGRIEILHSHMFRSSLLASPIGWACRVPVVIETPHVAERWRNGWFKGSFKVDRLIGRFVSYYIAVSRANAKYLKEVKGVPDGKIRVIRNGCDPLQFTPDRAGSRARRKAMGFSDNDLILLVPARLEPQKGHAVLLTALPSVLREFPQVKVVLVGDGRLRGDLEAQAKALGLTANIRFAGFQSNMADWYALADLMVLPSFFEGLPLVAIESLAAGCPVVATAVDGTPEVVINGVTGLTVPAGIATDLSEAIAKMFRDSKLRATLAQKGRDYVQSEFNLLKQVRETAALYRHVRRRTDQAESFPAADAVHPARKIG